MSPRHLKPVRAARANAYVPLSIRDNSRVVTWLWRHIPYGRLSRRVLNYDTGRWLAKRLP